MNRRQFVKELLRDGCKLLRSGGRHDIYINSRTGQKQPVPRYSEIDNSLARHIRKYLGLDE